MGAIEHTEAYLARAALVVRLLLLALRVQFPPLRYGGRDHLLVLAHFPKACHISLDVKRYRIDTGARSEAKRLSFRPAEL